MVSVYIGTILFFVFNTFLFINHYLLKRKFNIYYAGIVFYMFLSIWTIIGSPKPIVDTFDVFSQVTQKVLNGQNPYTTSYNRTYQNSDNHFHYLPLSFITTTPFTIIFHDPRFAIIFFNIVSIYILKKIFTNRIVPQNLDIFIVTFLFLPRSFYMLEHMYLDPIIFSFFLLFYFFFQKKQYSFAALFLAFFFSFKQNLFILLPIFIFDKSIYALLKKNLAYFLIPFLLIVFFLLLNPTMFLLYTFFSMFGSVFYPTAIRSTPTDMALSFQVFIKHIFPNIKVVYLYGISGLLLLTVLILTFFRKTLNTPTKIFIATFAMGYFMHLSFFNQYYFIALFYFFVLLLGKSSTSQIHNSRSHPRQIPPKRSKFS